MSKESERESKRKWYEANKGKVRENNKWARDNKRKYLRELKEKTPCADCGVSYPYYVMDFDHRDKELKDNNVAMLTNYGWQALKEEVAKCDVVCSNCHRIRSYG